MEITYYGHSCFSVKIGQKTILFDPFITPNELAKHIDVSAIQADYILISHGHQDHIADAVMLAQQNNATVVSNYEIVDWLTKHGVKKGHPMNIGGHWFFDADDNGTKFKAKCVVAVHSSVLPDGTYGGNPMGFLIESAEGNFYYAGDTALTYDMKLIGEYKSIDFAFLPIGNNFTMGIDNALIAAEFINCQQIIGMHYDTFGYIAIDTKEAVAKFQMAGNDLHLFAIGETKNI
jgi:L-ascorbate metabolism protein UlaG (beta-lactamase superfamily)